MMRCLRCVCIAAVALLLGGVGAAQAQEQEQSFNRATMRLRGWLKATAPSSAGVLNRAGVTIHHGLNIKVVEDLDFAEVAASATAGTVTISPAGIRSATGGARLGSATGASPAIFDVSGDPDTHYTIQLPDQVELHNGPERMVIDAFTSTPDGLGTLNAGGQQTLRVGARLNVGANQAPGSYRRVFQVTVAYD